MIDAAEQWWFRISTAYGQVQRGEAKKIEVDDITQVYRCGSVIRIDIKEKD